MRVCVCGGTGQVYVCGGGGGVAVVQLYNLFSPVMMIT